MRISVTRIAPRGGFSFAILAQAGLEPAPAYCRMVFKTISYTNSDIEPSLLICESPNKTTISTYFAIGTFAITTAHLRRTVAFDIISGLLVMATTINPFSF